MKVPSFLSPPPPFFFPPAESSSKPPPGGPVATPKHESKVHSFERNKEGHREKRRKNEKNGLKVLPGLFPFRSLRLSGAKVKRTPGVSIRIRAEDLTLASEPAEPCPTGVGTETASTSVLKRTPDRPLPTRHRSRSTSD